MTSSAPLRRPVVITLVTHYLPGIRAGGPIKSVANLVDQLGDEFNFKILTSDRDLGEQAPYSGITAGLWQPIGRGHALYLPPSNLLTFLPRLAATLRDNDADLFYLNSFFSLKFTILPLVMRRLGFLSSRPFLLAPRGEFSTAALAIKAKRKRAYLRLASQLRLLAGVSWQASTPAEASDIERVLRIASRSESAARIYIAPDLGSRTLYSAKARPNYSALEKGLGLRLCFVARISAIKNLHYALQVLKRLNVPVQYDVYGPIEDDSYWQRCLSIARTLPKNIAFTYCGLLNPTEVVPRLAQYDLLFIPSGGENFGHIYIESLSAGTPVLVSTATPWRNLREQGIGWDVPLSSEDGFVSAVDELSRMSLDDRAKMRENCLRCAVKLLRSSESLEQSGKMFRSLLATKSVR